MGGGGFDTNHGDATAVCMTATLVNNDALLNKYKESTLN